MRSVAYLSIVVTLLAANIFAQTDSVDMGGKRSFDLMISNTGLSFGNGQRMNGIRFAWRDGDFEEVNGFNFSFWKPYDNPRGVVHGLSFGIAGACASQFYGISVGLGGVIADESMVGVNVAGLGLVSQGVAQGVNVAGLGVVGQGDIVGFNFAGLGLVSQGSILGINGATLGLVSQKDLIGVNVGGLGTVAQGSVLGMNVGGLGLVAQGEVVGLNVAGLGLVGQGGVTGISFAGLGLVAQGGVAGISVAGLGLVAQGGVAGLTVAGLGIVSRSGAEPVTVSGVSLTLGLVHADQAITGVTFAGYKMESKVITGLNMGIGWTESTELTGLTCAAYNRTYGVQQGLVVGVFNHTEDLFGIQIGVLNYVESNPPWLRLLPLVNAKF